MTDEFAALAAAVERKAAERITAMSGRVLRDVARLIVLGIAAGVVIAAVVVAVVVLVLQ